MNIDEILEAISNMEHDDLQKVVGVVNSRAEHLNRLELAKFKPGDMVKVQDTKGNYHKGMVHSFTSTHVKVDHGHDRLAKINPHILTKWTREGEISDEA